MVEAEITDEGTQAGGVTEAGSLPDGWDVRTLGEIVVRSFGGGTPSTSRPEFWDGPIPWTTSAIIGEDDTYLTRFQRTITTKGLDQSAAQVAPKGAVLIGTRVGVGKGVVTTFDVAINQDLTALVPLPTVLPEFIVMALKVPSVQAWFRNNKRGTTIKGVPRSDVLGLQIPVPPPDEQRAIAHVLSTIQRAIEATERVIAAAREFKRSLMRHLFTYGPVPVSEAERVPLKETEIGPMPEHWRLVKLADVTERTRQVDPVRNPRERFMYVDVSAVSSESLRIQTVTAYPRGEAPSRARKIVAKDDIIFATVRPYLKRVAMVDTNLDGHVCSTAFCVVRCNQHDALPRFMFYALSDDRFVARVSQHQSGSSYPAVTDKQILSELVPLPPLAQQQVIARSMASIDDRMRAEEVRKAALKELFRTMLHLLMTGQIRVEGL